jgi:hypothetical protein
VSASGGVPGVTVVTRAADGSEVTGSVQTLGSADAVESANAVVLSVSPCVIGVGQFGVPVAVATLVTAPFVTSAEVIWYVAVQVTDAPAASVTEPFGTGGVPQVIALIVPVPLNAISPTLTLVSVTFPSFLTKKV